MQRTIQIRWALTLLQIVIAVALFLYGPYQYRRLVQRVAEASPHGHVELSIGFSFQHWPPPAYQVSSIINFPATAVAGPFSHLNHSLHSYQVNGGEFHITVRDVIFFFLVGIQWFWIGKKIDERLAGYGSTPSDKRWVRIEATCGLILALWTTVFAVGMSGSQAFPDRRIWPFCCMWALSLGLYFGDQMIHSLRSAPETNGRPVKDQV